MELSNKRRFSNQNFQTLSFTTGGLLGSLCGKFKNSYACDFHISDHAIDNGRVAATAYERESFWAKWCKYVQGFGVDLYLTAEDFDTIVRAVTGFGGRVR